MTKDTFNIVINDQLNLCTNVLIEKARQYATGDRLHNFKVAAEIQKITPVSALAGMMAKHTVSIYDMCSDTEQNIQHTMDLWEEKITDHINYLLLLKALLVDGQTEIPKGMQG